MNKTNDTAHYFTALLAGYMNLNSYTHAAEPPSQFPAQDIACEIIQALIDSPTLNRYFHIDVLPARAPLPIHWHHSMMSDVPTCPQLKKWGKAVSIQQAQDPAYALTIEHLTVTEQTTGKTTEKTATVRYRYTPEGIHGTAIFQQNANEWQESQHRIAER